MYDNNYCKEFEGVKRESLYGRENKAHFNLLVGGVYPVLLIPHTLHAHTHAQNTHKVTGILISILVSHLY